MSGTHRPLLSTRDLVVGYGGRPALPPINLQLAPAEIVLLLGPNGGGKSTLLRTLAGLQSPVSGSFSRNGASISAMLQRAELGDLMPLRAMDVVRDGLDRGWSFINPFYRRQRRDILGQTLDEFALNGLAHMSYHELSDGQRERVMLARTFVSQPEIILLDEPTSAMDTSYTAESFSIMQRAARRKELAILVATHDIQAVAPFVDRVLFVDGEWGNVVSGPPAEVAANAGVIARHGREAAAAFQDLANSEHPPPDSQTPPEATR